MLGVPSVAPPVGDESCTVKVRSPSSRVFGNTGTVRVMLKTPGWKVKTPAVGA